MQSSETTRSSSSQAVLLVRGVAAVARFERLQPLQRRVRSVGRAQSMMARPRTLLMFFRLVHVAGWDSWRTLRPIGHIRSCWPEKFGTPRQGSVVPDAVAELQLELAGHGISEAQHALDGIEEYSHVWLLWAAHLNGHDTNQPKVKAPKLRGGKAGVFATRSPFRPNPIGQSLVRLLGVDGDTLRLGGVDLVNGTPIIDVKPYIPSYDTPAASDGDVRTAGWVDPPPLPVNLSPEAEAALDAAASRSTSLLRGRDQLRRALVQTLAADPRPLYRWRRERGQGGAEYDVTLDGVCARCAFELSADGTSESVTVLRLTFGS